MPSDTLGRLSKGALPKTMERGSSHRPCSCVWSWGSHSFVTRRGCGQSSLPSALQDRSTSLKVQDEKKCDLILDLDLLSLLQLLSCLCCFWSPLESGLSPSLTLITRMSFQLALLCRAPNSSNLSSKLSISFQKWNPGHTLPGSLQA